MREIMEVKGETTAMIIKCRCCYRQLTSTPWSHIDGRDEFGLQCLPVESCF